MRPHHRLLLVVLFVAGLASAKSPTAAIFPFSARGVDSNSTRILEDALADGLIRTGKLRLLERSQMTVVLKEQGFQKSGACEGSECAVQMGKLLGIEQGVIGSVGLLGKTWVLNARVIDIGTGEVLKTTQRSVSGEIDKVLTDLIPTVASDLTGTPAATSVPKPAPTSEPSKKSSSAWVWWTLGGVAVAGGAAAAVLLTSSSKTETPATNNNGGSTTDPTGLIFIDWKNP